MQAMTDDRQVVIKEVLNRMDEISPAEDINIVEGQLVDELLDNAMEQYLLAADVHKIPVVKKKEYKALKSKSVPVIGIPVKGENLAEPEAQGVQLILPGSRLVILKGYTGTKSYSLKFEYNALSDSDNPSRLLLAFSGTSLKMIELQDGKGEWEGVFGPVSDLQEAVDVSLAGVWGKVSLANLSITDGSGSSWVETGDGGSTESSDEYEPVEDGVFEITDGDYVRMAWCSCSEWGRDLYESDLMVSGSLAWKMQSLNKFLAASPLKPSICQLPMSEKARFKVSPYKDGKLVFAYVPRMTPEKIRSQVGVRHGFWQSFLWYAAYVVLTAMGEPELASLSMQHAQAYQFIPSGMPAPAIERKSKK